MSTSFIKNETKDSESVKKMPFNKKKWREQKYSCKAKVQKWENIQRKQAQKQFIKECKKSNINVFPREDVEFRRNKPVQSLREAQLQYKTIQRMKEEKRKEEERIRKEKEEAIKAYKEKKAARFKKLSQKTRKGQPLMRGRIELMLEKIQKYYVDNNNT